MPPGPKLLRTAPRSFANDRHCPACGDSALVGARCTVELPAKHCDTPGSPHRHWICTKCLREWVELQTAEELAAFASRN